MKYIKFVSKRRFGVELEISKTPTQAVIQDAIIRKYSGTDCITSGHYTQDSNNHYWHVKYDGSCGSGTVKGGWEIASYVGKGIEDIVKISEVGDVLKSVKAKLNNNCALHVHVEIADFSKYSVVNLVRSWCKVENYMTKMVPAHRVNNIYCKNIFQEKLKNRIQNLDNFWEAVIPQSTDAIDRRKTLNLVNYRFKADKKTVEFRFPECTLEPFEIKNWVRLFVHFVELTKSSPCYNDVNQCTSVMEFLTTIGLHEDAPFHLFSKGLYETKVWVLHRLAMYGDEKTVSQAKEMLQKLIYIESTATKEELVVVKKPKVVKKKPKPVSYYDDNPW